MPNEDELGRKAMQDAEVDVGGRSGRSEVGSRLYMIVNRAARQTQ